MVFMDLTSIAVVTIAAPCFRAHTVPVTLFDDAVTLTPFVIRGNRRTRYCRASLRLAQRQHVTPLRP